MLNAVRSGLAGLAIAAAVPAPALTLHVDDLAGDTAFAVVRDGPIAGQRFLDAYGYSAPELFPTAFGIAPAPPGGFLFDPAGRTLTAGFAPAPGDGVNGPFVDVAAVPGTYLASASGPASGPSLYSRGIAAVPEPGTQTLIALGLVLLVLVASQRVHPS